MNFNMIKILTIVISILSLANAAFAKPSAVIIDVDDTLMDTRGRTREILLGVGRENNIRELATLELEKTHFSCHKTCANAGMSDEKLIFKVCGDPKGDTESDSLWGRHFFLNADFLRYDHVMPGSVDFMKKMVNEMPVHVIYLSGRKEKNMLQTTKEQLAFHHFPIAKGEDKFTSEFILKPESAVNNVEFKKQVINNLKTKYNIVFAIDDNLKNVNLFREMLNKNAVVVRLNHDVTDVNGMKNNIQQITNFYFNVKNKDDKKVIEPNDKMIQEMFNQIKALADNE